MNITRVGKILTCSVKPKSLLVFLAGAFAVGALGAAVRHDGMLAALPIAASSVKGLLPRLILAGGMLVVLVFSHGGSTVRRWGSLLLHSLSLLCGLGLLTFTVACMAATCGSFSGGWTDGLPGAWQAVRLLIIVGSPLVLVLMFETS
jgi:hypothetical protein